MFGLKLLRVIDAERPAEEVQRLEDARLPRGVRPDEDRESFQIELNVPEALEVADRHLADHGLAPLRLLIAGRLLRGVPQVRTIHCGRADSSASQPAPVG
jgi:hypothetical protein